MTRYRSVRMSHGVLLALFIGMIVCPSLGQVVPPGWPGAPGWPVSGVAIDAEGVVRTREVENRPALAVLQARARSAVTSRPDNEALTYVSLPRVLAEARRLIADEKPLPQDVQCLGGLTRIDYIFVYPAEKDLVIAGPGEAIDATNPSQPLGKKTGRPILQLDDLVVALRTVNNPKAAPWFGCSIDPQCDMVKVGVDLANKLEGNALKRAFIKAVGQQKVTVIGAAADTRLACVMVACDFKLKRMFLGLDKSPIAPNVGNALGNAGAVSNRFWFEPCYRPLLVSGDKTAYGLRGQRLQVKAGAVMLDARGATEKARRFSKAFTEHLPAMAAADPLFADLQNIADLAVLAALIRVDRLEARAGLDLRWAMTEFPVRKAVVPKTADTQVNLSSYSLAAGGVAMQVIPVVAEPAREKDANDSMSNLKNRPSEGWAVTHSAGGQ